jgi:hypothetical protein
MMLAQQGAHFDPLLLTTFFTVLEEIRDAANNHPDDPDTSNGDLEVGICALPAASL